MYSVQNHGGMIGDRVRMAAYERAIAAVVRPGSVVLDLGTGTGIMSFLACRAGAARVYAIEPSSIIQVAREAAAANALADRITFIQSPSSKATLPERVDVIVEDLRGALPWLGSHIPSVVDARTRFLKAGGRIISARDFVYCAAIEHPEFYRELLRPWESAPADLDLRAGGRYVLSAFHGMNATREQMLTDAHAWAELDYATIDNPNARARFELEFARKGVAHGLLLWFDGELAPGIRISNGPGNTPTVYRPVFLPLPDGVPVGEGDVAEVQLRGDYRGDDYVWTWGVRFRRPAEPGVPDVHFRQSTFFSSPVTEEDRSRSTPTHRPALDEKGEIAHFVLASMDGASSIGEIGERLLGRFPGRFKSLRDASDEAVGICARYGR